MVKLNLKNYNKIPLDYVGQNILEIGPGKQPILKSNLRTKILDNNYLGIDVDIDLVGQFKVKQGDIITYLPEKDYFDTIIMLEVLEHIHLKHWLSVIHKLKSSLKKWGYLIISTPYNERLTHFIHSKVSSPYDYHTIFGINKKVMKYYFPNCVIKFVYYLWFREGKENVIKSIGRFIRRLFGGNFPLKRTMMVFWQKK